MENITSRRIVQIDTQIRHPVEPGKGFPPLMEDTRTNYLAKVDRNGERVYVKAIAGPYAGPEGVHILILPETDSEQMVKGFNGLAEGHLATALEVSESFGDKVLNEEGLKVVQIGVHYAHKEWKRWGDKVAPGKQRSATFENLHIHVMAANLDSTTPVSENDFRHKREYYGRTEEPFEKAADELMEKEILPQLVEEGLPIENMFEQTHDNQGRFRLKLKGGRNAFKDNDLARVLQAVDQKAHILYEEIGGCFFERNAEGEFAVDMESPYQRFKLLPAEQRRDSMRQFLEKRPWLSNGTQSGLRFLAMEAKPFEEVVARELDTAAANGNELSEEERKMIVTSTTNRFMAYRGLGYATTFIGQKSETTSETEWSLGVRPNVFIIDGFVEMSETMSVVKKSQDPFSESQLAAVQEKEKRIIKAVQAEIPDLKDGPGLANGI